MAGGNVPADAPEAGQAAFFIAEWHAGGFQYDFPALLMGLYVDQMI